MTVRNPAGERANGTGAQAAAVAPSVPSCLAGWLATVVPASARRFRVAARELAVPLLDAGAELVDERPDVEIGEPGDLRGDAAHAVATLDESPPEGGGPLSRAPRRLAGSVRARLGARRAQGELRRHGYRDPVTVMWDCDHPIFLPQVEDTKQGQRLSALVPTRALVVGARVAPEQTVLEAVAEEVSRVTGTRPAYGWPLAREGMTVAIAPDVVLRVAIGQGRQTIGLQRDALAMLRAAGPPPVVADRVPWLAGDGRLGLADWCAERRMQGRPAPADLPGPLLDDCVEFLLALFALASDDRPARTTVDDAEVIAVLATSRHDPDLVRALGRRLAETLAPLPRGFVHGDFWSHNLLVESDRLVGVIDWDSSGPARLPLLDLLHLRISAQRERPRKHLGTALVEDVLPWARTGGDELLRGVARRFGFELDGDLLVALTLAYWLDRTAFELRHFADRTSRDVWMRGNVGCVLDELAAGGRL